MEAVLTPTAPLDDAMSRLQAGSVDDALAILRAHIQRSPSDGHAHALIGICYAQQGSLDAAVKSLETAAILNPQDAAVEYNLANALFQVGRIDQAKWRLTRLLEDDPAHEEAKLLLTHIQRQSAPVARPAGPALPQRAQPGPVTSRQPGPRTAVPGYQARAATPAWGDAPGLGLRLLRGAGWGLLYAQSWTVFSLFGAIMISLLTTKVEHAVIAFLVLCTISLLFHSAMGLLTGIVSALLNADDDGGGWVGMCVGFLILLVGLRAGFLAMWAVVFYIFMGRWIGRSVAARIQKPVPG